MTDLIACLSSGKGTWAHVARLAKEDTWNKVFLITDSFGKEKFEKNEKFEFIEIDPAKPVGEIIEELHLRLKEKVSGIDVGLNLVSGTGKEHMAILAAVLKLGVGIRLVAITKNGLEEISTNTPF